MHRLILIAVTIETGSSLLALLVEIFAVIMSIVGLVCCVRRWGWVRWAAALQGVMIMIAFISGARLGGLLPFPELRASPAESRASQRAETPPPP
ncbi:hypothetical protein ACIQTT_13170 [Microbacterium sp. NPDC090225]|uniref:hypothetical protein n=1 Tax=Microbacterium sp. NPDC090225 TaxID=3364207 RepID=UPI003810008A